MSQKRWYTSVTVWLAIAQAVSSLITVIIAEDPTLLTVGWLGTVKSAADIIVRLFMTSRPITF